MQKKTNIENVHQHRNRHGQFHAWRAALRRRRLLKASVTATNHYRSLAAGLVCAAMIGSLFAAPLPAQGGDAPETVAVQLAASHTAHWPVVVGAEADERVRQVAEDLAAMLGRITGATFDVVESDGMTGIAVGTASDFPALKMADLFDHSGVEGREDYLIRSHPEGLWLIGARPMAAQHAVWDLLQRLGYRFYLPSPTWEIVPEIADLEVAINDFQRPDYYVRRVGGTLRLRRASWLQDATADWQARNRAQSDFTLHTSHAYQAIVRRNQEVFDENPEFLALIDGERRGNKMCTSNPDLRAFVAGEAVQRMLAQPDLDSLSMDPSDGGNWCECADCEALGTPSDRAVTLANEVATALNELNLGPKYVGIYAYNWHSPPPSIDVHPKVIVSLESTHLRFGTTLEDMLDGWGARARLLGKREAYARSFTSSSGFLPGRSRASNLARTAETLPYWKARGVRFLVGGGNANWGANGLGYYLAARILWNVEEADRKEAIIEEFLDTSFGPAAAAMRDYFTAINWATEAPGVSGLRLPVDQRIGNMYRALAAARPLAPDAAVRDRIDDLILYTRFVDLYQHARRSQEDFDALVAHIWRARERNMIDVVNTISYLNRFVVRRDDAIEMGEGVGSLSPADRHREKEDVPFSDAEIEQMVAAGLEAYPEWDVDVVVQDFGDRLTPAGFDLDAVRGTPSFHASGGHRGNLNLALWTEDDALPVLYFSAGHTWPGRGPLRWTLYDQQGNEIDAGEIPSEVDPPRQSVGGGEEWRRQEWTHELRLEVPEPGVYRFAVDNTGQGYFWDYDPRPGAGLVIRADETTPVSRVWLSRHYFYVPRGVREIQLWGELRPGRHAWIRPDGTTVDAGDVVVQDSFTFIPVPEGMDGQVWSFRSRHSRPELRFLSVPGWLAYHPNELVLPGSLLDELPAGQD